MHHTHFEAIEFVQRLSAILRAEPLAETTELALHPSFTALRSVQTAVESDAIPVSLGAQNCHFEDRGPYTGEVSAEMLAKLNIRYVIVGHSERRAMFAESDEIVRLKVDAVLRHAMTPIVCVGESLDEREDGRADVKVADQVVRALGDRPTDEVASVVVAYEPLWAIGTGQSAGPADAQAMAVAIRATLRLLVGDAADAVRIQYGGSVTAESAPELLACRDVDGLLVGGASLEPGQLVAIAHGAP